MFTHPFLRCIGTPLIIFVLAWGFTSPASARGGGSPTGPTVQLSPPTLTLDADGGVVVTTTLLCWGDAVASGHVTVSVGLGQQTAGGGDWVETNCAADSQLLTLYVVSATGKAFHPGPVSGIFEFYVYTESSAGQGIGEIDQLLMPVQADR